MPIQAAAPVVDEALPSVAVRAQAAFVRTLVDEIGRRAAPDEVNALEEQLFEELTRFACMVGGAEHSIW